MKYEFTQFICIYDTTYSYLIYISIAFIKIGNKIAHLNKPSIVFCLLEDNRFFAEILSHCIAANIVFS